VLGCESLQNFGYRGAEVRLEYALAREATGDHHEARRRIASASAKILGVASRIEDAAIRRSFLHDVTANAHTLRLARAWLPDGVGP
jgi:eukaryotic-like serine/threonine-protein kinase